MLLLWFFLLVQELSEEQPCLQWHLHLGSRLGCVREGCTNVRKVPAAPREGNKTLCALGGDAGEGPWRKGDPRTGSRGWWPFLKPSLVTWVVARGRVTHLLWGGSQALQRQWCSSVRPKGGGGLWTVAGSQHQPHPCLSQCHCAEVGFTATRCRWRAWFPKAVVSSGWGRDTPPP